MSFSTKLEDVAVSGTPLREFEGRFHELSVVESYGKQKAVLDFTEAVVIKTTLPYNLPVVRLETNVSYNGDKLRGNCTFGRLLMSVAPFKVVDFMDLKGKVLRLRATEKSLSTDKEIEENGIKKSIRETNNYLEWAVVAIDGKTATTSTTAQAPTTTKIDNVENHILKILDGKTMTDFSKAVLADPDVAKSGTAILGKIFDNSLIEGWVKDGKVKLVGDKYVIAAKQ